MIHVVRAISLFAIAAPTLLAEAVAPQPVHPFLERALGEDLDRAASSPLVHGNRFELLADVEKSLEAKRDLVTGATRRIFLATLVLFGHGDPLTLEFVSRLEEKARSGVAVHLVVDSIGALLDVATLGRLERAGVRIAFFNPPSTRGGLPLAVRNHEKVLVVDDRAAVIGGSNLLNERFPSLGAPELSWRDTDVRVEGPAAAEAARHFVDVWNRLSPEICLEPPVASPALPGSPDGAGAARFLANEPAKGAKRVNDAYRILFRAARRRIVWQGNFVDLPGEFARELADASRRDVEVVLLTNSGRLSDRIAGPYHYYLARKARSQFGETGVQVRQYRDGFDHSKVLVVDGRIAVIGSVNHDWMSLENDAESALLVYDPELVAAVEARVDGAIAGSDPFR